MGWPFLESLAGSGEGPGILGTGDPCGGGSNPFVGGGLDLFSLLLSPSTTDGTRPGASPLHVLPSNPLCILKPSTKIMLPQHRLCFEESRENCCCQKDG